MSSLSTSSRSLRAQGFPLQNGWLVQAPGLPRPRSPPPLTTLGQGHYTNPPRIIASAYGGHLSALHLASSAVRPAALAAAGAQPAAPSDPTADGGGPARA